ncbi:hypothetical protein DCS_01919 [Drechmeria coniospora]|uniref:Cystathionine gamma-synthase n=1 Tax=Drechmeria coniospora TaxID=98403 RepID=A0A151GUN4_DRECN|nr:hypothetical protein DCS_01919 [Drechmeria coniospora]KYK60781.1 hypothetical protein DCS_01919 [Drechmeria coniospora]
MSAELGESLPPGDAHAVSVSLPRWRDTEGWASRDDAVLSKMKSGYPRFYVPHIVRELSSHLIQRAASNLTDVVGEDRAAAMLFPSERMAIACQRYLSKCGQGPAEESIKVLRFSLNGTVSLVPTAQPSDEMTCGNADVWAVLHPEMLASEAKAFWQHTGFGISSRFAQFWMEQASFLQQQHQLATGRERSDKGWSTLADEARTAALTIRQRIAGLCSTAQDKVETGNVFLYHSGMSAIAHTAWTLRALVKAEEERYRIAVFGFVYVDTFKVLSKIHGFDCTLYGHGSGADMDRLEEDLRSGLKIHSLYTEFPGNPLLISLDLDRVYELSRRYGFYVVVDDTIGTSVNLDLVPLCDVLCTSLTKMFSGGCNVMGGSVVVSPRSRHHGELKEALEARYEDTCFPLDTVVLERNSVDFEARVGVAGRNAAAMAEQLRRHRSVERVYYPKGSESQQFYDRRRREGAGYGYLLSIRFVAPAAAVAFHDALDVAKGPSLGTNFTLMCAYTLLAHYSELEWAARYGVIEHLVRISVGVEDEETLRTAVGKALAAADEHC